MPSTVDSESNASDKETAPRKSHSAEMACIYPGFSKDRGHHLHVSINRNGKIYQKHFPEKRCGGKQNAMKLAQAWRDTIIAKHAPMSLMKFCSIVRTNNTSGMPGIYRTVKRNRTKDGQEKETVYWQARIPMADGQSRGRNFSVIKFGEEDAKLRAIDARMQGLRDLEDIAFREKQLPRPVSTEEDIALLEASLRAPAERRAREIADRHAKRKQYALRAAEKLAQTLAAEEDALARTAKRSDERYIGRYATPKGTSFHWRVGVYRQGTLHRKCFSDSVYGGTAEALLGVCAAEQIGTDRLRCSVVS